MPLATESTCSTALSVYPDALAVLVKKRSAVAPLAVAVAVSAVAVVEGAPGESVDTPENGSPVVLQPRTTKP
jgi:hypothetical protein